MIVEAVRPYYGFQGRYWKAGETVELPSGSVFPEGSFRIVGEDSPTSDAIEEEKPKAVARKPVGKKK